MKTLDRIENLLKSRNISKKAFLNYLGYTSSTWGDWRGGGKTYYDRIHDIAQYFNVTSDYLLGLSDIPNPPTLSLDESKIIERYRELSPIDRALVKRALNLAYDDEIPVVSDKHESV
ncbi:MAG: helix-turn-helix domain-containing protein [Oscillospiraceae bacterium]|nr:helix-turn-helix domain-containing protein [Oscillospiraceae bacterium]